MSLLYKKEKAGSRMSGDHDAVRTKEGEAPSGRSKRGKDGDDTELSHVASVVPSRRASSLAGYCETKQRE